MKNALYYGDCLDILRCFNTASADLIYLDPPFNSKAGYNILFSSPAGDKSRSQIEAFEDTWHWCEQSEREFSDILKQENTDVSELLTALRRFLGANDVMAYIVMLASRLLELHRVLKHTGSIYLHCDPTASHYIKVLLDGVFGQSNFINEIIWHYSSGGVGKKHYAKKHDVLFFYTKTKNYTFNYNDIKIPRTDEVLRRINSGVVGATRATTLDKFCEDVFRIPIINPASKERLGYPTQKPLALLERIVRASSNEGDVVLDPFCGCGTAVHAAQKLGRKWIGIDITHLAVSLIEKRIRDAFPTISFDVHGTPKDIEGARDLALRDKYQFQWWACSLVNAQPYQGKKKGADGGIDGLIFFQDELTGQPKKIIVSVKGGQNINVAMIRDLAAVIEREKAEIGFFVTLEEPTKPMRTEATAKGLYTSPHNGMQFPRIQILTVKDLLEGREKPQYLDLQAGGLMFKKTEREKIQKNQQLKLKKM